MITPSARYDANRIDTHHLLWRAKEWRNDSKYHKDVRQMRAYRLDIPRYQHDILHTIFEPVHPPPYQVVRKMHELGKQYDDDSSLERKKELAMGIGNLANTAYSLEVQDAALYIAGHLLGQLNYLEMQRRLHSLDFIHT